ncbi:rhomboid family intramembrane serine protease [Pedobacter sp.]|uniref:rhomboid family intramembrane serine protease n=1 Tax=Pedobacter sp. TaxID=1411316 RepID=UPI002B81C354|nr:rhomboid family intramembrane serine protease [Pedobacter sp.]HWW39433.1 rhomboid family intramembrane serine protease [Pedobacter sp.]
MFPPFIEMPLTYVFSGLIILLSIVGFYYKPLYNKLVYHPFEVFRGNRIHTLFTSVFLHKNWKHLIINIYFYYFMSKDMEYYILEKNYNQIEIKLICLFVLLFSVIASNLIVGWAQRYNLNFTSVGASGAVTAFAGFVALYFPIDHVSRPHKFMPLYYGYDFAFALLIIFAILTAIYRKKSLTNHKIHLTGLLIGFVLAVLFRPVLVNEIIYHLKSRW